MIPTAEEFTRREYDDNRHIDEFAERQIDMKHAIWMMQTFTTLHCKAQKEAIRKELEEGLETFGISLTDDFKLEQTGNNLIDNAYPLDQIK